MTMEEMSNNELISVMLSSYCEWLVNDNHASYQEYIDCKYELLERLDQKPPFGELGKVYPQFGEKS